MVSNIRIWTTIFCLAGLSLFGFCSQSRAEESAAYQRQVQYEIDRANDFHRFQKFLQAFERDRMTGVAAFKLTAKQEALLYEKARVIYSEWKKKEDAKKPTDEFIEMML